MALFCTVGQSARVTWKFAGRAERSLGFSKCPIDVTVSSNNGALVNGAGFASSFYTMSGDYKYAIFDKLDPTYFYEIFSIAQPDQPRANDPFQLILNGTGADYSQTRLLLDNTPSGTYFMSPQPQIRNGSSFQITGYAQLFRFSMSLRRYIANGYKITITDSSGYVVIDTGTTIPTFSVKCGGCPPNTLDCDCCPDCGEIKSKLIKLNERL